MRVSPQRSFVLLIISSLFIVSHVWSQPPVGAENPAQKDESVRLAVFNIKELSTTKLTEVDSTGAGQNAQLRAAATIIQEIRPDILVLNEIDHDYSNAANGQLSLDANAVRFVDSYLKQGEKAVAYPYVFTAPCNTGMLTGLDLNQDGTVASDDQLGTRTYGEDSFGWGTYPGQYSMALLSRFPIATEKVRTFQKFLWKDLPGHHLPEGYFSNEAVEILRLSSKSHWDVPVTIGDTTLHLLLSHPTPPVFDGEEDRNGRRNFDEIKFWVHYLENDSALYDDRGNRGGLPRGASFVIAGDLNAAPSADSRYDGKAAIEQLLNHARIQDTGKWLVSAGGSEGKAAGPPDFLERSTAQFGRDFRTRIDYLLPSEHLEVAGGGVYWPASAADPEGHHLAETASDHRLIWLDIRFY